MADLADTSHYPSHRPLEWRMLAKAYRTLLLLRQVQIQRKVPFLPPQEVQEIQNQRVRSIVAHAYHTIPYYRATMDRLRLKPSDFRSAPDLAQLPLISKEKVNEDPASFLSTAVDPSRRLALKSSGTTGLAAEIFYNFDALLLNLACASRELEPITKYIGISPAILRAMMIAEPNAGVSSLQKAYQSLIFNPRRPLLFSTLTPLDQNLDLINRFQPQLLIGQGSYLGLLFQLLVEKKITFSLPKAILAITSAFPEHLRRRVEEELAIPIFSSYGSTEALRIGFFCEERNGFHLHSDLCHVRIDGNKGRPNEIVVSNLTNKAMVILNYRLGDLGRLSDQPCPCGRTLPLMPEIVGRVDEVIFLPGERFAIPAEVYRVFHPRMDILDFQVIQTHTTHFTVRVVPYRDGGFHKTKTELTVEFKRLLGEEAHIHVEPVDVIPALPNGKIKRIHALSMS